jgi:hypothetical protein
MLATLQHHLAEVRLNTRNRHLDIVALRSPGESIRRRIDRNNDEMRAFAVAIGTIPIALYAALLSYVHFLRLELGWMESCYLGVLSAGFLLYGSNKLKRLKARKRRLCAVYEGQMAVAQEVGRLMPDGYRVYHDFPTDRFHIAHIIVGPNGVFTVTIKVIPQFNRHANEKALIVDGSSVVFNRKKDDRVIPNAAFQASWLAKWLLTATGEALAVQSVLTIPGWRIRTLRKASVACVPPEAIRSAIKRFQGSQLTDKMMRQVCEQVEAKCRLP